MKLYEIESRFRAWDQAVDEAGGELSPELEAELEAVDVDLAVKADALWAFVRERTAQSVAFGEEAKFFAEKARRAGAAAANYRDYLLRVMRAMGREQVVGARWTISVRRASAPRITCPGGEIPDGFIKVQVALDGTKAQKAFRDGVLPDGLRAEYGYHLEGR